MENFPIDALFREAERRANRVMQEVMEALYAKLPVQNTGVDFKLSDGTECKVFAFHPPREIDGEWKYGFDVRLSDHAVDHIEFSVRCSGWGRNYITKEPTQ